MNEKTYKYWLFYEKYEGEYKLYGYTDNKELAKDFRNQRNDKIKLVKKEITKSEVNYLAREHHRKILKNVTGVTKSEGIGSELKEFSIVVTEEEDIDIDHKCNYVIFEDLYKICWELNPYIFTDEVQELMDILGINDIYNKMIRCNDDDETYEHYYDFKDFMKPDYLSAFINEYGYLMRIRK